MHAIFSLAIPLQSYNPLFVVNSKLFIGSFLDSINEDLLYDAGLAGLSFELSTTSRGFQLLFSGFGQKMNLFVQKVLDRLTSYRPTQETYLRMRDLLLRDLSNWDSLQPYQHAAYFASLASETLQYPIPDLKQTLLHPDTNIDQLQDFLTRYIVTDRGSHGTALVVGNINEQEARKLADLVDGAFPFRQVLSEQDRARRRAAVYPTGSVTRLQRQEPNQNDDNSATTFYFQLPSTSPKEYMLLEFLSEVSHPTIPYSTLLYHILSQHLRQYIYRMICV